MEDELSIGETYKALREQAQEKKQANQEYSTELLIKSGIQFESKNYGNHLVVESESGKVDFWPSTGKFIFRNGGKYGRGVRNLIKRIANN